MTKNYIVKLMNQEVARHLGRFKEYKEFHIEEKGIDLKSITERRLHFSGKHILTGFQFSFIIIFNKLTKEIEVKIKLLDVIEIKPVDISSINELCRHIDNIQKQNFIIYFNQLENLKD